MSKIPVIAIIDIGKTNKKLFFFDESYRMLFQQTIQVAPCQDEDGDDCEDLDGLKQVLLDFKNVVRTNSEFEVKLMNVSAHGASFVYLDKHGRELTPLYSYLKDYPYEILKTFLSDYNKDGKLEMQIGSPILKSLNSGMQLYRLKYEQPKQFNALQYAMHLPQYITYLLTGTACSDITSIGCHTALWDFEINDYHHWVALEEMNEKLAAICDHDLLNPVSGLTGVQCGIGIHDSSAALIPYLFSINSPFILVSTGTWNISFNPFDSSPLDPHQLQHGCSCFLTPERKTVKASRFFAGAEHDRHVKKITEFFGKPPESFNNQPADVNMCEHLISDATENTKEENESDPDKLDALSTSKDFDPSSYANAGEAYQELVLRLAKQQVFFIQLIQGESPVKTIYVDGGFSRNKLFMQLLALLLPDINVYAACVPEASALGAALLLHKQWNRNPLPADLVPITRYPATEEGKMHR